MTTEETALEDIVEAYDRSDGFSGVALITEGAGGGTRFAAVRGPADRTHAVPNALDTRFPIASGSKIFTSVAVCRLVQEGALSFDTLLRECLPIAFPEYDAGITIHHLLTHTSGITSYFEEDVDPDYEALWRDLPVYRMRSPADYVPLLRGKPMKFEPAARFEYNDGGFILLGLVIEAVTGRSFDSVVTETVLEPAGMTRSGYFPADRLPPGTAAAYIRDGGGAWRSNVYAVPIVGGGDGGAYTTVADLARFWAALEEHRLLSESVTRTMLRPHVSAAAEMKDAWYGYGVWLRRPGDAVTRRFVTGWDPGVAMISSVGVDAGPGITILANVNCPVVRMHDEIAACAAATG